MHARRSVDDETDRKLVGSKRLSGGFGLSVGREDIRPPRSIEHGHPSLNNGTADVHETDRPPRPGHRSSHQASENGIRSEQQWLVLGGRIGHPGTVDDGVVPREL
ncbi:hypothetical protein GCM10009721_26430 [Terrabacter tumescens]|uniref:Uncharacterized protein n=1 Tax=Terrabacter tumescens TaxID=60443 RepID=A0ABQ2I1Y2_9MICO|nr:hypothetical protein GCM10009721_26430 [Terrabacter tumescens]